MKAKSYCITNSSDFCAMSDILNKLQSYVPNSTLASWAAAILTANKNNCCHSKQQKQCCGTCYLGRLSLKPVAIGPHKAKHTPLLTQLLSCLDTDTCLQAVSLSQLQLSENIIHTYLSSEKEKEGAGRVVYQDFSEAPSIFAT